MTPAGHEPEVRIVGLANRADGWPGVRAMPGELPGKSVDADFAGDANGYSPKTVGLLAEPARAANEKGGPAGPPSSVEPIKP